MIVSTVLYFAAYLTIGYDILRKAWKGICNHQVFDENFLMAVATIGAIALAIYEKSGDYAEAVAVMLFYQIGELFQSYAVGKSRRNITALMDIRPDYANIERDGKLEQVDPDDVAVGTRHHRPAGRENSYRRRDRRGLVHAQHRGADGREPPARRDDRRRGHQRLHQHDGRSEGQDNEGLRRVHGVQDFGADGKLQLAQVPLRGVHLPLCPRLHPRRVLQRAGAGHSCPRSSTF